MSSEAIARLRGVAFDGRNWGRARERADLRALLDSYTEALDALATFADAVQGFDIEFDSEDAEADAEESLAKARAVLAKAGRL